MSNLAQNGPFLAFLALGDTNAVVEKIRAAVSKRRVIITGVFYNNTTEQVANQLSLLFNVPSQSDPFIPKNQVWLSFK